MLTAKGAGALRALGVQPGEEALRRAPIRPRQQAHGSDVGKIGELVISGLLRSGCYVTHDHGFYKRMVSAVDERPHLAAPAGAGERGDLLDHVLEHVTRRGPWR